MEENKNIEPEQPAGNIPEVEQNEILPSGKATTPLEENILPEKKVNTTNEQSSTINSQLSTEQEMEVHHHTHSDHGKKNWKSYFWEFLMLFLAVFCGFLAEYQLEHKIERDREKKFIETFIEDLKTDTADINRVMIFHTQKKERMDSLMLLLSTGQIKGHENELYFFGRTLVRTSRFIAMTERLPN